MPDRRSMTKLDDLPEDLIVDKILILLPAKDIGRCRTVRKSWRSATSTPKFMLDHHRRQPSLPIIDGQTSRFVALRCGTGTKLSDEQLWPIPTNSNKASDKFHLHTTCDDGLVIVSQGPRFYICNPAIHKHAPLPLHCPHDILGLYRHKATGEYRVLWCTRYTSNAETLFIHTVGANESRSVTVRSPTAPSSSPSLEQALHEGLPWNYSNCSPVHLHGGLHWLSHNTNKSIPRRGDIIVFDTTAESFRWMRGPVRSGLLGNMPFEMEGKLALWSGNSYQLTTAMDVWVMQDYDAEIWTLKYRIDVSTVEASRQLHLATLEKKKKTSRDLRVKMIHNMVVLNDHELLIQFNYNQVLRCDIGGKFLEMVNIGKRKYCMKLTQHRLKESIIPILFDEMQEEEDEEPPFSTRHV